MARPRNPLKRVRDICLALPEASEKEAWGRPTFRIRGKKMFAMYMDNHHDDGRLALWVNAPPGEQDIVVEADPERFFVPPYMGPSGWVGVRLDRAVDWDEVADLVRESYRMGAPKKLVARLEEEVA
jgi:hypothetical protein